jgi:hypothetical protein
MAKKTYINPKRSRRKEKSGKPPIQLDNNTTATMGVIVTHVQHRKNIATVSGYRRRQRIHVQSIETTTEMAIIA